MAGSIDVSRRCSLWLAWGSSVLVALLAGCASQPKGGDEATAAAPTPAAEQPTPAATPAKTPAPAPSPSENLDHAVREMSASNTEQMSDAQREALVQMIQAAITAQMKATEEKPVPSKGPPPDQSAASADRTGATVAVNTAAEKAPAAKSDKGCGPTETSHVVDLTPPALDAPQPKFACKEIKLVSEGVWQGQTAEFTFQIANEGEGPLSIRLRGG